MTTRFFSSPATKTDRYVQEKLLETLHIRSQGTSLDSGFIVHRVMSHADWTEVLSIRTRVFIEEQACPSDEEWDEHDTLEARFSTCRHFLGEVDGVAVATARWHSQKSDGNPVAKLERFAVLEEARRMGFGRAMVVHLMEDARANGFSQTVLHAQVYLEKLYANLGFVRVGDVFSEARIPHVKMVSMGER